SILHTRLLSFDFLPAKNHASNRSHNDNRQHTDDVCFRHHAGRHLRCHHQIELQENGMIVYDFYNIEYRHLSNHEHQDCEQYGEDDHLSAVLREDSKQRDHCRIACILQYEQKMHPDEIHDIPAVQYFKIARDGKHDDPG